jgi:hypothetical protein
MSFSAASNEEIKRFGRVVIDARGIRQERWLRLFGCSFFHAWETLLGWSSMERVVRRAGVDRPQRCILELRTHGGVDWITRKPADPEYSRIVAAVRERVPDLEGPSLLESTHALRSRVEHG